MSKSPTPKRDPKTKSKIKAVTSAQVATPRTMRLFDPPLLLEGEDAAAYDELLARVCAAVKPTDVIDEMFVNDVVYLQWEILRLRRLKLSLTKASLHQPLENFLTEALDYRQYRQDFEENLAEILQAKLPEDQAEELAHQYARSESAAVEKVNELLDAADMDNILDEARANKAIELAQAYARCEPGAIKQVTELLASSGRTIDDLMADVIFKKLGHRNDHLTTMERIDHLITISETRRNAMLREVERRHAALGEALRRDVQEVDGEFEVIEKSPAEAKSAA